MRFAVQHRTSYDYDGKVAESINEAYLCPISNDFQICREFELDIQPDGASVLRRLDFYTNQVYHFELLAPHNFLRVVSRSQVETFPDTRDFSVFCDPDGLAELGISGSYYDFLIASQFVQLDPMFKHEAREIIGEMADVRVAVEQIMAFIFREFTYSTAVTNADTSACQAFEMRGGVCQDFAHVMIALCRAVGIPSRYVSGYFYIDRNEGEGSLVDNTESHAWVDCFLPGIGWVGYDPTHNRRSDERYIRVAIGRDYSDVRPVSGSFRGQVRVEMNVSVEVSLLDSEI